ncbi:hypothetical protein [Segatella oulorum]|uniref:hypothetical protein n=1 Tax=Segatella oulorum TaxID=28136 RepID=UPI0028E2B112|nr:hypothetical protein [Segatella oulorum]
METQHLRMAAPHFRMETPLRGRVALQGRIHRSIPTHNACVLVWKRRYADVRAGTQAPPLPFQHTSPF